MIQEGPAGYSRNWFGKGRMEMQNRQYSEKEMEIVTGSQSALAYRTLIVFLDACLLKKDIPGALDLMKDDIYGLLRGDWESAVNKEQLGNRLQQEMEQKGRTLYYKISNYSTKEIGPGYMECFGLIESTGETRDGEQFMEILRFSAGMTAEGDGLLISSMHISEIYRYRERDYLTGVYNREGGEKLIRRCLERGGPYVFLMIDLDNFKKVNDLYGHGEGDRMLQYIAGRLQTAFRLSDIVLRLGGDEFAVFAYPCSSSDIIRVKVEQISRDYMDEAEKRCPLSHTSVSVGGIFGEKYRSFSELYKRADEVLYEIKLSGKGKCVIREL
ncbi:hypothetical protein B5F07_11150 [Lachnoclostridium sp. An169]|nr:hypothetical protein B5F07_11150 [Lachnoclostridium sp. An169]